MFSIAAINDEIESKKQWEPLAPTKEAQEFHLSQTYHEGLLKLQAKEYDKARELLETVLKDPLISSAQVDTTASDSHLLQLRFLALKNLATVFLQQGPTQHENALHCYLQAVEIDTKDSVIWNQLGTLSCSMGLLSVSRWAFEQGLFCSPNNWNCMEKLMEVLTAIGDEVSCLSVAKLILKQWPSHSRALYVKNTIEDPEPIPFAPKGIDKLEPKHAKLKFTNKRKQTDTDLDELIPSKKLVHSIELHVVQASWAALADAILGFVSPVRGSETELRGGISQDAVVDDYSSSGQRKVLVSKRGVHGGTKTQISEDSNCSQKLRRCRDIKLIIQFSSNSENPVLSAGRKGSSVIPAGEDMSVSPHGKEKASILKEKETCTDEEHPQERRSTRLGRLRSRKPGKEETDSTSKDLAKTSTRVLERFVIGSLGTKNIDHAASGVPCPDLPLDGERNEVTRFIMDASKNYGVYHLGHLLLEEVASRSLPYQETHFKFLELEKWTRCWCQDRTANCCLFLAELYYDFGLRSSNEKMQSELLGEASYHLCKVIERVLLDTPDLEGRMTMTTSLDDPNLCFSTEGAFGNKSTLSTNSSHDTGTVAADNSVSHDSKSSFWIRFSWLSARLKIWDGEKEKACEELTTTLALLRQINITNGLPGPVPRPHCKLTRELTVDRVLHEISLLRVDFLLKNVIGEMIEKEMFFECMLLLAPLLLSNEEVYPDLLPIACKEGEDISSVELLALDKLIMACEKAEPMDVEINLKCQRRKLQLLAAAGMAEHKKVLSNITTASEMEPAESTSQDWSQLISEEVKVISQCASQVKNFIDQDGNSDIFNGLLNIIGDIQAFLLPVICNIVSKFICKKSSGVETTDQSEELESRCLLDASIAFCKLQHLNQSVPAKDQVELIVAIHELLSEYGLCCAGKDSEGVEGTFLKFAIKHLLALDMKIKTSTHSPIKGLESAQSAHEIIATDNEDAEHVSNGNLHHMNEESACSHHVVDDENHLSDSEGEKVDLGIDTALDQCFFCLYGLDLRSSDSSSEDDLAIHKNTNRGDYQTKEQCADVFQYILPYIKASSRAGLVKVRKVLRAIRKHFPQPPEDMLKENSINNFLDNFELSEDKLCEEAGSSDFLESVMNVIFPSGRGLKQCQTLAIGSSPSYLEIYGNLYYYLAQAEETSATDKWPGFVLTKEGEDFVEQNANLFKYDLLYNPLRFDSWQRLANIYDEEVDLLLNDGSKHINVVAWRKNPSLPQRVETSRRRSRRCFLMSLALAKTAAQQSEIHELLALVYYDGLQNVVPIYDQRSIVPTKDATWMMFCQNSMKHFEKAFAHKPDWSHAFYLGKLCEKLGYPHEKAFSYYETAITLNPSAVDPVYRMHASRLKLLCTCGKHNVEALKVVASHPFDQSINVTVLNIMERPYGISPLSMEVKEFSSQASTGEREHNSQDLEEAWNILYDDCLSALEVCIEGDLKHFHKARYMLAQGCYRKGDNGGLEKAKDELSFCFKSSRSSFTINMWEIDGMVKKGRRKAPGLAGNRKALEVNLPESSRKFITCIRKYTLFYLKLLQKTGDVFTLERAYVSLRTDKRFSLCLEDLVPVALGRYVQALMSSIHQGENAGSAEYLMEKMFSLFMDQGNLWADISNLSEIKSPDLAESSFYGYLHQYIQLMERDPRMDMLEGINEKIRKRFKNPKLSSSNCAKVCRHALVAWYRSIVIRLAMITPLHSIDLGVTQVSNPAGAGIENRLLCVDLRGSELWNSSFEDPNHLKDLETKWGHILSKIKGIVVKQALEENSEAANNLLRSSYNFYRESFCGTLPSGIDLYTVQSAPTMEGPFQPGMDGVDIIDLSIPRKLLLWAYTLVVGRYSNILSVVKYCEENGKTKMRKATAGLSSASGHTNSPTSIAHQGAGKEKVSHNESGELDIKLSIVAVSAASEAGTTHDPNLHSHSSETQKTMCTAPLLQQCNSVTTEKRTSHGQESLNRF